MKKATVLLTILFFGSLIGLNEAFTGSFNLPYRSVILSSIALSILSIARHKIPKKGTSVLIVFIAILFTLNNSGFYNCSANMLLCGPTALALLGISYEIFSGFFLTKPSPSFLKYSLTCGFSALSAFGVFGLMNTYILGYWDPARLMEYFFIKGTLTAIFSSIITLIGITAVKTIKQQHLLRLNPSYSSSILGLIIIALWLFGSLTNL